MLMLLIVAGVVLFVALPAIVVLVGLDTPPAKPPGGSK